VNHIVPPEVSYENYLYYLQYKREALGIPDPWADGPPDDLLGCFKRSVGV